MHDPSRPSLINYILSNCLIHRNAIKESGRPAQHSPYILPLKGIHYILKCIKIETIYLK